jgi:hypothetical protein
MSDKIKPYHLERKAILYVYVRQSSSHQVPHNHESRALIRHAGSALGARLVRNRDDRQ